MPEDSNEG